MNINFDWYNVFYYVCEFKSVTKAANFLCVSQPAVTKNIRNLENVIGKRLIIRTTTGIEITEYGLKLYDEIKDSIEKLNFTTNALRDASEDYNQVININAGVSTVKKFLMDALIEFNKKYPNIKFVIRAVDSDISLKQLEEGRVDLIFLSGDHCSKEYNNIFLKNWKDTKEYFVISEKEKDKYPKFISANELNNYPIICKLEGSVTWKYISNAFEDKGLVFKPTYQLSTHWLVEEYVKKGLGIGVVVNNLVEDDLKNRKLIRIRTDLDIPVRKFCYAYRKDSNKTKIIEELIAEII